MKFLIILLAHIPHRSTVLLAISLDDLAPIFIAVVLLTFTFNPFLMPFSI